MFQMLMTNLLVACRTLAEQLLMLTGLFRLKALFQQHRSGRKRIAFQAYAAHLAQLYETIIHELLKEPDEYEVVFIILAHPHFSFKSTLDLKRFVHSRLRIPAKNIRYYWQIIWEKFDLIMFTDVYAKFPLRTSKKCLLKHGPGLTERFFTRHFLRKTIADFDLILVNGRFDHKGITEFCRGKPEASKVYNIGFPFLDRLERLKIGKETYLGKFFQSNRQMTILFAPSWSGLRWMENQGRDYFDGIVSILGRMNMNTVIKLHACSFNKILAGGVDWKAKLGGFAKSGNVQVDYGVDDLPALKYCDVLITDISSRAFTFMLLDKPVIFCYPSEVLRDKWDPKRMELIQRGALVASSPENIREVLSGLINGTLSKPSSTGVAKLCFTNYGKATESVVKLIKEI